MGLIEAMTPIGEILIEDGVISRDQLNMALTIQEPARKSGQVIVDSGAMSKGMFQLMLEVQLVEILVDLGYASEEEIYGPLRAGMFPDSQLRDDLDPYDDEDVDDFSDF